MDEKKEENDMDKEKYKDKEKEDKDNEKDKYKDKEKKKDKFSILAQFWALLRPKGSFWGPWGPRRGQIPGQCAF